MKNTGKAESAFEDSGYAVGEGVSLHAVQTHAHLLNRLWVCPYTESALFSTRCHSTGRMSLQG